MTTIKLNDPVVDHIVKDKGLEVITEYILQHIKNKFSPDKKYEFNNLGEKIKNSKTTNKKIGDNFLALTENIKDNLSKSYTAKEAKQEYLNNKI